MLILLNKYLLQAQIFREIPCQIHVYIQIIKRIVNWRFIMKEWHHGHNNTQHHCTEDHTTVCPSYIGLCMPSQLDSKYIFHAKRSMYVVEATNFYFNYTCNWKRLAYPMSFLILVFDPFIRLLVQIGNKPHSTWNSLLVTNVRPRSFNRELA